MRLSTIYTQEGAQPNPLLNSFATAKTTIKPATLSGNAAGHAKALTLCFRQRKGFGDFEKGVSCRR